MNHFAKSTSRGLLPAVALGISTFAACGSVSEDPLAGGNGGVAGKAGATSDSHGGASGLTSSSGSGGVGDKFEKDERGGSGGGGNSGSLGGEGGVHTFAQGGAGEAGEAGGTGHPRILTRCSSAASFGTPERVPGMPEGAVRLRLDPSETIGYYAYHPGAGTSFDLEVASRTSRVDAFSTGTSIDTNDSGWDFSPTLTGDGSVLYFERRVENLWRIHQSVWDPAQQAFGPVDPVPGLGIGTDDHSDGGPYAMPSGNALYFHSNRSGNALYRAQRIGTSFAQLAKMPFTLPVGIALTTAFPVVSPDELTLYFTAHESGGPSDIWRATRAKKGDPFGDASPVVEVNTADANEVPSFVSEDGCRLYLDRNSNVPFTWNPPAGNSFVAEREPDLE